MIHSMIIRYRKLTGVWLLFLIALAALTSRVISQGGDCLPLDGSDLGDNESFSREGLISDALGTQQNQTELRLLNYTVVCVAQGTVRDRWRMVSGVAQYMINGETSPTTTQFHFQCAINGSGWSTTIVNSTDYVLTDPDATLDTPLRTDCALCISPSQLPEADNEQHCVSCASECNGTGLMRCTSRASSDCCTHYNGPEGQCVNGSCPGNSVPNESFDCICPPGYTGSECTTNVNECEMSTNPCANGANCTDTDGNFTCDCPAGFTGNVCEINVDECDGDPCINGGTCTDNNGSFTCECPSGFTGSVCDVNVTDDCRQNPCMNGGTCMESNGSFVCWCPSGYAGVACEENVNDCDPGLCVNGAECISGVNESTCNCTENWSGAVCDVCTLEGCVNCTADQDQGFAAVCIQCEDGYRLESEVCIPDCQVDGCVNCSQSSDVCEQCGSGLTIAQDGSSCSGEIAEETTTMTVKPSTATGTDKGRLIGIIVGSVVGGLLLIVLVAVIITCAWFCHRKKSRVTLTFDLATIKATHVTANPVFEEVGREDSGIENDEEIMVNKGALEFDDS